MYISATAYHRLVSTYAAADTRTRLLGAAAEQVAATPGRDISLRAVCDAAGVKMPTLYHFFGSKQGLLDAVIERGFELYLGEKHALEHSEDPIQDLRDGWDAHVAFGLANPGFYTLMYGKVEPRRTPAAQAGPNQMLLELTRRAYQQGRLVVTPEEAAGHILCTNVGVTLRQIITGQEDHSLSVAVRDGAVAAITGTAHATSADLRSTIHQVLELAAAHPDTLGHAETHLLTVWLGRLADELPGGADSNVQT